MWAIFCPFFQSMQYIVSEEQKRCTWINSTPREHRRLAGTAQKACVTGRHTPLHCISITQPPCMCMPGRRTRRRHLPACACACASVSCIRSDFLEGRTRPCRPVCCGKPAAASGHLAAAA
ncbi:hypothetical protein PVAP13_2NG394312 [Panicum virgatum]|uniref:Uncharacterized protein n=1 Tax=Panicum virgatum TaxID=38727 RepID=A0A8T0VHF0_PANVG|nr:hypothetical protein PVAP13_2NG394312 [Panicum virgatum]